jgi:hypothetical protein
MIQRIKFDPGRNPEFAEIVASHKRLMEDWNTCIEEVHAFRIDRLLPFRRAGRLRALGIRIGRLADSWLKWQQKSEAFALNPRFHELEEEHAWLIYSHSVASLHFMLLKTRFSMDVIIHDYNRIWSDRSNQLSFNIAILSFALTFLGLLASLWSVMGVISSPIQMMFAGM